MKSLLIRGALSALVFSVAGPAFADLIYVTGEQVPGTGLGAVTTVVTVQDNDLPGGGGNGVESGCVTYTGGASLTPTFTCSFGLQGGDNTSGNAGNNLYLLSNLDGLTSASQLGFVVNISEGAPENTATLTDLYLSLFKVGTSDRLDFAYTGPDLVLGDSGGIGQSGTHFFILDDPQAAAAAAFCPVLSGCVLGGGIQFLLSTTSATPETVYVGAFSRPPVDMPEPLSLALLGLGLAGMGVVRRRSQPSTR